jgi:hypothetical protein
MRAFSKHRIKKRHLALLIGALLFLGLLCVGRAFAQTHEGEPPPAPSIASLGETYRLRVENTLYGRVELSFDGGATYTLVGRVLHPARTVGADPTAKEPGVVLRSEGHGLAFSVGPNRILKLRPNSPPSSTRPNPRHKAPASPPPAAEPSAIQTNLEPASGLFGDLLPPAHTSVRLQSSSHSQALLPIPPDYALIPEDVFVFSVLLPRPAPPPGAVALSEPERASQWHETVRKRIEDLGAAYAAGILPRAQAERRTVANGTLTLQVKLPAGEPDPISVVIYLIDGDMVAAQNREPFTYAWDTRRVPDGEHVIEIRALNRDSRVLTQTRKLVVVDNAR